MTLQVRVHIFNNPYPYTIPAFADLFSSAVRARADDIERRHAAGEFERNQMAFSVLDPTRPPSASDEAVVLALALVGEGADFFAPNALAKAFALHDHGAEGSALVTTDTHRLPDGSFRFGGAVEVAGTIVGGSGQTELQDRYQCSLLAADLNYAIGTARKAWEAVNGPGRWFRAEQAAPDRFRSIVERSGLLGTGGEAPVSVPDDR